MLHVFLAIKSVSGNYASNVLPGTPLCFLKLQSQGNYNCQQQHLVSTCTHTHTMRLARGKLGRALVVVGAGSLLYRLVVARLVEKGVGEGVRLKGV